MHHLAAIVESSRDAIYGMNLDSTIISWNPAAERIYGYSADEIIGRLISVLFPLNRRDELLETMASIRRGRLAGVYETKRRRKDGRVISESITCSPIKNAEGKITGVSVIARDISRHKQDEEDRLKLIKDLTKALSEIKTLASLLPICPACKRIHEGHDTWSSIETYLANKSNSTLTQKTCPECSARPGAGVDKTR
jgi:PAS domain S-box-containing protein